MSRTDHVVDRAVLRSWTIRRRLGSVVGADRRTATVLVDQAPEGVATVEASNAAGILLLGDRVWVDFLAPKGAVVIGRVADEQSIVGEAVAFNTGWGPGDPAWGPAMFWRTLTGEVRLGGAATRTSGTETTIFALPDRLRPRYTHSFPVVSTGSVDDLVSVAASGLITWGGASPTNVILNPVVWEPRIGG